MRPRYCIPMQQHYAPMRFRDQDDASSSTPSLRHELTLSLDKSAGWLTITTTVCRAQRIEITISFPLPTRIPHNMYVSLWLQALLILQYSVAVCEQQILAHEARHRNATLSDANDITTILITAFSPLPSWQYLYQFREDFPEEHRRCVRSGVVQILSEASTHAEVIEAPTDSNVTLAAVVIWTRNQLRTPPSSHLLSSKTKSSLNGEQRLTHHQGYACTET